MVTSLKKVLSYAKIRWETSFSSLMMMNSIILKKIRSSSPCCQPSSFSSRALFRVDQKFEKIVQGGIFEIRFVFLHTTAFFQCSSVENSFKKTYSKLHNFSILNPPPMGSSAWLFFFLLWNKHGEPWSSFIKSSIRNVILARSIIFYWSVRSNNCNNRGRSVEPTSMYYNPTKSFSKQPNSNDTVPNFSSKYRKISPKML